MKERDVNTLTQLSPTDKSCYVYRSRTNPQVLVCLCNTEVEPEQSYSWVTQVWDLWLGDGLLINIFLKKIFFVQECESFCISTKKNIYLVYI